jgi:PKD repeat protein
MKKIVTIILLAIISVTSQVVGQCMLKPISLTERVNNSSLIVEGVVISKKSYWNAEQNYIYTSNLVQVKQVLKGSPNISFLEIITNGGEVDNKRLSVEPALMLNDAQEGVFMLNAIPNKASKFGYNTYETYADEQGFIKFDMRENTATDLFHKYNDINVELYGAISTIMGVQIPNYFNAAQQGKFGNSAQIAAVTGISPTNISAGTFSVLTITGTGFGTGPSATNFVSFLNADDGGATFIGANATQYVSWTATQIQVRVPTRTNGCGTAGTGQVRVTTTTGNTLSATSLTVNYGHLNLINPGSPTTAASQVYNTRHVNDNASGGYTWVYSTNFISNALAVASFTRAIKTWTCATYINWIVSASSSPIIVVANDGVNIVRFDDAATPLPAGVLGRCSSWWSGCGSNPNMNWFVAELDIEFDNAVNWQYGPALATGSQYDFESVCLHELGHGHQLSHVINNADVMHYAIANAVNKRTLNVDDIAGGNAVMTRNLSGGVCSAPVMVQMSSASCTSLVPTASFVVSPTLVCTGQVVSMTDQSTNGPITWTWTLTGGTPASSNVQNPTVTYATAGTKTITLMCSNSNGPSTAFSQTISVVASPTVAVSSASICPTKIATLTASGAASYTWTPGNLVGATQTLSPGSTQVYNVIGSNGTCTNSSTGTVTVLPGANPSVSNSTICAGNPIVKTATGATTYTWFPGNVTGSSQTFSPSTTTTYTVIGTVGTCTGQTTFVITTTTILTGVSASPTSTTVCAGSPVAILASGATTYTWNPGNLSGASQTVSPAATTVYTVTGATGGCVGTATCIVNTTTVLAGVSASPTSTTVCVGSSVVVTGSGASTYTWNPGNLTGSTQTVSPGSTTVYTLTGKTGSCSGSATMVVNTTTVLSGVSISPNNVVLCAGQTTVLTASGAVTYTWNTSATTNTLLVTATSTVYTVTGKTGSCSGTANATITLGTCSGLSSTDSEFVTSIYPNPTQGIVVMKFTGAFSGSLTVYNTIGQLISEKKLSDAAEYQVDISSQPNGVYMIKLRTGSGTEKVIKVIKE